VNLSPNQIEKRLQIAGIFIVLGLVVEALCLLWSTPIAFVVFVGDRRSVDVCRNRTLSVFLVSDLKAPL